MATILSPPQTKASTPMRALTSSLAARASPPVPPAAETYEPLLKAELRRRLTQLIFPCSAIALLMLSNHGTSWNASIIGLTALQWLGGILPLIVMRKANITAEPTPASSPSVKFRKMLAKPGTKRALSTYLASSLTMTALYAAYSDPTAKVAVFIKSKKHPYYLNGRLLYLLATQIVLALAWFTRELLHDRFFFHFNPHRAPSTTRKSKMKATMPSLPGIIVSSLLLPSLVLPAATVLFVAARLAMLALPIPYAKALARGPWWAPAGRGEGLALSLISRAWWLAVTTAATWEWTESVFENAVAMPTTLASTTASAATTLVSAISTPSGTTFPSPPSLRHHYAYAEICHLPAAQLSVVFTDQKYLPTLWSVFCRESLGQLGRDYSLLLRRGAPPPKPAPAPPPVKQPSKVPSTPFKKADIFRHNTAESTSPLSNVLDALASDGQPAKAADSVVPELFRSVAVTSVVENIKAVEKKAENVEGQLVQWAKAQTKKATMFVAEGPALLTPLVRDAREWLVRERLARSVEVALPHRELDKLVVRALCRLTSASLTEDTYGVVQRDIPRILEALSNLTDALEAYDAELLRLLDGLNEVEKLALAAEIQRARDVLTELWEVLKEGLRSVVGTFGHRLQAFKFPPKVAKRLQDMVRRAS